MIIWAMILFFTIVLFMVLVLKCNVNWRMAFKATFFVVILTTCLLMGYTVSDYRLSLGFETVIAISLFGGITISTILWHFYRDPERRSPDRNNVILSPADGTVRYVKEIMKGKIPFSTKHRRNYRLVDLTKTQLFKEGMYLIGVEMSILNVHVNRAPVSGKIILQKPSKGKFLSLRNIQSIFQNERVTTVINQGRFQIAVVQIASRSVRRIVSYFHEGDEVQIGQRIGMIKFGSQVDVAIQKLMSLKILVKEGESVKAGETVLATYG